MVGTTTIFAIISNKKIESIPTIADKIYKSCFVCPCKYTGTKYRIIMLHLISKNLSKEKTKKIFLDGKFKVKCKLSNEKSVEGEFICETVAYGFSDPVSRLTLLLCERRYQKIAEDYFEALCNIRELLEKENIFPFCYGACEDVYPIGMRRGVDSGLNAYQLEFGEQAKKLVHIFDSEDNLIPVPVAVQRKYFKDYCNSFRW